VFLAVFIILSTITIISVYKKKNRNWEGWKCPTCKHIMTADECSSDIIETSCPVCQIHKIDILHYRERDRK